jgi:hypothetical protein
MEIQEGSIVSILGANVPGINASEGNPWLGMPQQWDD